MQAMTVMEMNTHLIGLVRNERKMSLEIISFISLFERWGGHLKMGYTSMHDYLTRMLGYSDDQAYRRLKAARLYHQMPEVGEKLKVGSLNLTQVAEAQKSFELAQKETGTPVQLERKQEILDSISKKTNFETKAILAEELNLKSLATDNAKPQAHKTVRLEITLTAGQFEKLKQIKSLLSYKVPSQNTADVFDVLFNQYLDKHTLLTNQREKKDPVKRPIKSEALTKKTESLISSPENLPTENRVRSLSRTEERGTTKSRYIPAKTKRLVYQRSQGCCEHIDENGHRCNCRYQLNVDHI